MRCFVEGHEVPDYFFLRQNMNFGQPWPVPARPLQYRILVDGQNLADKMRAELERAKEEEIADAPFHRPGEVPELDRWEELGYPQAEDLLARHPAVLEGVLRWLGMETLDRLLPYVEDRFRYVVNSLDRVEVTGSVVSLVGRAYERTPAAHEEPSPRAGRHVPQGG